MENNQRNSRKRLNSLILLVAFTAVMLIVSTYAWFSTQKNVTLGGIQGTVNVAEGLQISLDAKTWKNEIDFGDFTTGTVEIVTEYDTDGVTPKTTEEREGLVSATYAPDGTLQNPTGDTTITNVIPEEMLPVSTTGTESIDEANYMYMYNGTNENGYELRDIYKVDELSTTVNPGYFAIDLYLQNSSASGMTSDVLQLEPNSAITISTDKASTGLQNTLRVALVQYNDLSVDVDGVNGQTQILTAASGKNVKDVAIWEPNANAHVDYIVNNQRLATAATTDAGVTTYTWASITATTQHNTWAINETVSEDDADTTDVIENRIDNIYYWNAANTGLTETHTVQTPSTGVADVTPLYSAKDGTSQITIPASEYVKCRMYIWLEGQDIDCINHASLGGGVTIDFGFSKPGSQTETEEETETT